MMALCSTRVAPAEAQGRRGGIGGSPLDAYGYSFANNMTNIWRGAQNASSRYWYDLAGNLVTSIVRNVTNVYFYNAQNKLAKVVTTNTVYEFRYNSRNERIMVGTSLNGGALKWRYDICQGPVTLAEYNHDCRMTRWYVRGVGIAEGIGDILAEVDVSGQTPKPHYYLYNHRGDVLVVLNPNGEENTTYRYDAFGNHYQQTGPFTPRYTFSTKEYLPAAGLYLYQYRVYDPIAGRWTQRDPIDYQDSINLYQFCGNNPVNGTDSEGRFVAALTGAVLGGLIGGAISARKGQGFWRGAAKGAITGGLIAGLVDGTSLSVGAIALTAASAGAIVEATDLALHDELNSPSAPWKIAGAALGAGLGSTVGGSLGPAVGESIACGIARSYSSQLGAQLGIGVGSAVFGVPVTEGTVTYFDLLGESFDAAYRVSDDVMDATPKMESSR